MRYDFDMCPNPDMGPDAAQCARFRDPKTCAALAGAGEGVQTLFLETGFDFTPSGTELEDGIYAAEDREPRLKTSAKFMALLRERLSELSAENWNGFDLRAFLRSIEAASPMSPIPPQVAAKGASMPRRISQLVLGLSLIFIVFWAQSNLG